MRIARTPRGPTLCFRIAEYMLAADVLAAQKRPRDPTSAYREPPAVVIANFGQTPEQQLAAVTFQSIFPPLDLPKLAASGTDAPAKRLLLISYDEEEDVYHLRHYTVALAPAEGRNRLRKLLMRAPGTKRRTAPDLGDLQDVSDMLGGYASESGSESEGEGASRQKVGRHKVSLKEVGPRLTLELVKVQEGVCDGQVLFHKEQTKTPEEAAAMEEKRTSAAALKTQRRRQQEENVARKQAQQRRNERETQAAEAAKAKAEGKKAGAKRKREAVLAAAAVAAREGAPADVSDDDAQYFREAVGQEADAEFVAFSRARSAKRSRK